MVWLSATRTLPERKRMCTSDRTVADLKDSYLRRLLSFLDPYGVVDEKEEC